jgi:hypothetical protein
MAPGQVRYLPASFEKRFARSVAERVDDPTFEPSAKQWAQIARLAHRYRRQVPAAHTVLCGVCVQGEQLPLLLVQPSSRVT